jgi:hypothetical protein
MSDTPPRDDEPFLGGQRNNITPGEIERMRRQQFLRLGLIVCMTLIFMDGNANRRDPTAVSSIPSNHKGSMDNSSNQYTKNLNNIIDTTRKLPTLQYPKNITGVYNGIWERDIVTSASNDTRSTIKHTNGKYLLRLWSVRIDNVPNMDFVYGVIRIFKVGPKDSDIIYPLQGKQTF